MQATAFGELAAKSMRVVMLLAVLGSAGIPPASATARRSPVIDRITVRATGSIWGQYEPGVREIVVERRGDGYVVGDRPVPTAAVRRIADDLNRSPLTMPTLESLRLPDGFLASVHDACGRSARAAYFPESTTSRAREAPDAAGVAKLSGLLRELCIDQDSVDAAVRARTTWSTFHEGPHVYLTVRYSDGSVVSASSSDETLMRLPWTITRGGVRTADYDADLGLAIADVLPDGFSLRNHLRGDDAGAALGYAIGATSQRYQRAEFAAIFGAEALAVVDGALVEPTFRIRGGAVVSGHPHGSADTITLGLTPRPDAAATIAEAVRTEARELTRIRRISSIASVVPQAALAVWEPNETESDPLLIPRLLDEVPPILRGDAHYAELRASAARDVETGLLDEHGAGIGYAITAPSGTALLVLDRPATDAAMPDACVLHAYKKHTWTCRSFADARPG